MTMAQTLGGSVREVLTVSPDAQASTADPVVLDGSEMDVRAWRSLAYTLKNITNTITYNVFGANISDYSDEVVVSGPTDILAAANSSYAVSPPPYGYYRVKIEDKVDGNHGTVTLNGICKY